ncbi:MAG: NDP-sugar synthase [Clostridia bacterium]|nr:NDP-sugar synthase [Clostridia bacterium]
MKAIILAGGEGKRLRPLTSTRPKPLMRVGDRTLLDIMLERLGAHGITSVAITLGYRGDDIIREIGDSLHGVKIDYYREEKPLGTAGCVKNCESFMEEDTLILSADALTDIDFTALFKEHKNKNATVTLTVTKRQNPRLYGVVDFSSEGRVVDFREKPQLPEDATAWVNCGIYMVKKEVTRLIPKDTFCDFAKDVFPKMLEEKLPISVWQTEDFWCDIGSFAEYRRSNLLTLSKGFFVKGAEAPTVSRGTVTDSIIGRGSRILSKAVVKDSVVGRNTRIGSRTRLDSCILGDGVTVGENVSISAGAVVGDFAIVGDGVKLTEGVYIEPYTVFMG